MLSPIYSTSRWSSATSPNSLMMTAVSAERRVLEQAVEQRGLAGAEKAGEHGRAGWAAAGRRRSALCAGLASLVRRTDLRLRRVFGALGRARGLGAGFLVGLFLGVFFLAGRLLGDRFFFFARGSAVCTASGWSGGPVNTLTGGSVSTGGPSTNLPFGRPQAGQHEGLRRPGVAGSGRRLPASASSSSLSSDGGLRRWPPHISSRRLGGCASIGASASTVPSEGVSQDRPPPLKPRSSSCAAFCARTAPE